MPTLSISLPKPHPAQATVLKERRRFNVVCCGRRFGKTTLGVNRLVMAALPGRPVAWCSPSYRMLTEVWRDCRRIIAPVVQRVDTQQHRIELVGGGVIEMWSLDQPDVARGRKYALVVVDEAAMVRDLEDAWAAVLRPTLVDFRGGAWFLSTPKGLNYFKRLFDLGNDPGQEDWAAWQMPTSSNPHIPPDEIEAARSLVPERTFVQEFLARFLDDGGLVYRRVLEAATAVPQDGPLPGHRYAMGVDLARRVDFTVAVVLDLTTHEVAALDRFNQIDWSFQVGRLRALAERFGVQPAVVDQTGVGDPVVQQLQRELHTSVVGYQFTNATKAVAVEALALAFERGEIGIPDDPVLINELLAFEGNRLPSGMVRYEAPPGAHDDCVMALALAWQAAILPTQWVF
jgi:hypothetical protein